MERLTDERAVIEPGTYLVPDDLLDDVPEIRKVSTKELYYRLGMIENALGKNYDLGHLRELIEADRRGRCVVLPIKEGETVYRITWNPFEDDPPEIFDCAFHITDYYSIGRTVFLTEEEAEVALKAMKERK